MIVFYTAYKIIDVVRKPRLQRDREAPASPIVAPTPLA